MLSHATPEGQRLGWEVFWKRGIIYGPNVSRIANSVKLIFRIGFWAPARAIFKAKIVRETKTYWK
jgi:hypothetical protein